MLMAVLPLGCCMKLMNVTGKSPKPRQQETTTLAKRLLDAQRRESDLWSSYEVHPLQETLQEWKACRESVDHLCEEYLSAVRCYRQTVEALLKERSFEYRS
ncbi:MAG: hypothetical protein C5B51_01600 [Terriglobia bacterium]|nr:MAG: hypothetical protein C5B51_01600 [Terriglobia bacterium]